MASFWRENQLVQTKKKRSLKEISHGLENQNVSYGLKLFNSLFFWFFHYFLKTLVVQMLWKWKACYGLKEFLRAHHTLLILDLWIEPQAFKHAWCTIGKNVFFNARKGSIQSSICFKLIHELLVLGPLSKVTLKLCLFLQ
jgi:hypothetical protein